MKELNMKRVTKVGYHRGFAIRRGRYSHSECADL